MKRLNALAALCAAAVSLITAEAVAQSLVDVNRTVSQTAGGAQVVRGGMSKEGSRAALDSRRGLFVDGQGHAAGASSRSFSTAAGGEGLRTRSFKHNAGSGLSASGQASASGSNGSAERSGSLNLTGDGNGSGERNTTLTNANTGNTVDASTNFSRGSGFSRSATCTDSAGNSVSCGAR